MKTRVFTCNKEGWPYTEIQDEINQAKEKLRGGKIHIKTWSCGRIKQIKVGDQAYFYRVGSEPRGFFACGRVITSEINHQSRLNWLNCQDLSEAYTDIYDDLRISYEWYSVVDYDKALKGKLLKSMPDFDGYRFLFKESGSSLREEYVKSLNKHWEIHAKEYGVYTPMPTT